MSTQVQIQGAAAATQNARTLVSRVLDIDTTNKRIHCHDGATVGGIPHVNYADQQEQTFIYGAGSGTNAITVSLPVPITSLQSGMVVVVKIANTNTGSTTLNVDGLGAVTVKKQSGGSLVNLSAGDLVADSIVPFHYNGTNFVIGGAGGSGAFRFVGSVTGANVSSLDVEDLITTGSMYMLLLKDLIPSVDNSYLGVRTSADNGSTYDSNLGHYVYEIRGQTQNGVSLDNNNNSDSKIRIGDGNASGDRIGNGAAEGGTGVLYILNPSGTARYKAINGFFSWYSNLSNFCSADFSGWRVSTAKIDAMRFYMQPNIGSGNISGTIEVYELNGV